MNKIIRHFVQGLLYTVPISIVLYVVIQIFLQIGEILNLLGIKIHPAIDPIIGLFVLVAFIITIGILGSSILFRPIFSTIESIIEKAPLIKTIYSALKDLMSAFVGSKKRFNQPVLVKMSKSEDIERFGFVTSTDLSELGIPKTKVAVYFPFSYAISGHLYIVPSENITPLNVSPTDLMKFIISGGVSEID
jgi:uncharacterized membrane protein